jgi:hypothetical protein
VQPKNISTAITPLILWGVWFKNMWLGYTEFKKGRGREH